MLKAIICFFRGHVEYWCDGCQKQIGAIFDSGQPAEWQCTDPDCRRKCAFCEKRFE